MNNPSAKDIEITYTMLKDCFDNPGPATLNAFKVQIGSVMWSLPDETIDKFMETVKQLVDQGEHGHEKVKALLDNVLKGYNPRKDVAIGLAVVAWNCAKVAAILGGIAAAIKILFF